MALQGSSPYDACRNVSPRAGQTLSSPDLRMSVSTFPHDRAKGGAARSGRRRWCHPRICALFARAVTDRIRQLPIVPYRLTGCELNVGESFKESTWTSPTLARRPEPALPIISDPLFLPPPTSDRGRRSCLPRHRLSLVSRASERPTFRNPLLRSHRLSLLLLVGALLPRPLSFSKPTASSLSTRASYDRPPWTDASEQTARSCRTSTRSS